MRQGSGHLQGPGLLSRRRRGSLARVRQSPVLPSSARGRLHELSLARASLRGESALESAQAGARLRVTIPSAHLEAGLPGEEAASSALRCPPPRRLSNDRLLGCCSFCGRRKSLAAFLAASQRRPTSQSPLPRSLSVSPPPAPSRASAPPFFPFTRSHATEVPTLPKTSARSSLTASPGRSASARARAGAGLPRCDREREEARVPLF